MWDELLPAKFRDYARVVQEDGSFFFQCGDRVSFRVKGTAASMGARARRP